MTTKNGFFGDSKTRGGRCQVLVPNLINLSIVVVWLNVAKRQHSNRIWWPLAYTRIFLFPSGACLLHHTFTYRDFR